MAQAMPRSESYWKPVQWLEELCAQEISLQFDRPGAFLQGRVEENLQIKMC